MTDKTVSQVLDIIDDIIPVYERHKSTIRLMFGGWDVDRAGELISTIKGFFKK